MQKRLKTKIIAVFVAFAAFAFVIQANASFSSASIRNGQTNSTKNVYLRNCARCHGPDGLGHTQLGRKLDVPDLVTKGKEMSSAKARRIITNGKTDMPGFGKTLTRRQISNLAEYIRKL